MKSSPRIFKYLMISSQSLERLIERIKAAACPDPQMIQIDEDLMPRPTSKRDLFEQLIDSDQEESANRLSLLSRQTSMRPESPSRDGSTMEAEAEEETTGCKCSKIDCLKLYCQCFARGRTCGKNCICVCCGNHQGNEAGIYHAKRVANFRNPGHFPGVAAFVPPRRCTCKKSSCSKNYCECYRAGVPCGEECECTDCRNGKPHHHRDDMSSFGMEIERYEVMTPA